MIAMTNARTGSRRRNSARTTSGHVNNARSGGITQILPLQAGDMRLGRAFSGALRSGSGSPCRQHQSRQNVETGDVAPDETDRIL